MAAECNRRQFLKSTTTLIAAGTTATAFFSCGKSEKAVNEKLQNWKIGFYTRPWSSYDYKTALDAIAETGCKYVGLMTTNSKNKLVISKETTEEEALKVKEEVKKRGLAVASVWGGNFDVKNSLQSGIQDLRKIIDNCFACGSENLLIGGTGDEVLFENYYKAVAECCDYAQEKGVELALKPHGGLNSTGPQCRQIIEKVNHGNFRLWYDPGNIFYYSKGELDPVQDVKTVADIVAGMCVKDYLHPQIVAVTPGTGLVDFNQVFSILKENGFSKGSLIVEVLKPGDLKELQTEAIKTKNFISQVLTAL